MARPAAGGCARDFVRQNILATAERRIAGRNFDGGRFTAGLPSLAPRSWAMGRTTRLTGRDDFCSLDSAAGQRPAENPARQSAPAVRSFMAQAGFGYCRELG